MSAIEVKRIGDGSTRTFDTNEIGDGTLLSWVTQNDSTADGLVRFLNQSGETGNAMAPNSLERFPKIVEDGSLITDGSGSPIVGWDGENAGYEFNFADDPNVSSSTTQVVEVTANIDAFKGTAQTIVNSDGLRIWEREGRIHATIHNPDTSWQQFTNAPGNIQGFTSYDGDLYLISANNDRVYRFDEQNDLFVDVGPSQGVRTGDKMGMFVFGGKLWTMDNGDPVTFWAYDGTSWSSEQVSSPVGEEIDGTALVPYKEDLYAIYRGGPKEAGGIMRYNTSNQSWETDFLLPSDISNIIGEDIGSGSADVDIFGAGVWRDELYFPLFSGNAENKTGDKILKYNPQDGWKIYHEYKNSIGFTTVANPYDDAIYNPGANVTKNNGGFKTQKFENPENSAYNTVWDKTDTGELYYQAGMKTYDEDLYIGQWFSWDYDENVDGVYKWDGKSIQVDLQTDGGPWKALGVHKGELWASHKYVAGEIYKKGNGAEISVPYDTSASEVEITAAVLDGILYIDIDDQSDSKTHNISYKNIGKIRFGLSYGAKKSDQHAGVDEVFQGSLKEFVWHPALIENVYSDLVSENTLTATTQIDFRSDTKIFGTALTNLPTDNISKIEVQVASSSGGSFSTIKTVNDPPNSSVSFSHSELNTGEKFFYKTVVTPTLGGVSPIESSEISAIAEYQVSPTLSVSRASETEASGGVEAPSELRDTIDHYEVFRKSKSESSFSKSSKIVSSLDSVTFTESDLTTGTTYEYKARIVDSNGGDTAFSPAVTVFAFEGDTTEFDIAWGIESAEAESEQLSDILWSIEDESSGNKDEDLKWSVEN